MLEAYNRDFADKVGKAHPGILKFAEILEGELEEKIMDLNGARGGEYRHGTKREKVPWPEVPRDFERFKKEWEKRNEVSVGKRKRS